MWVHTNFMGNAVYTIIVVHSYFSSTVLMITDNRMSDVY